MSDVILDSCVVAKWVLPETDSAVAKGILREVVGRGDRLVMLDLVLVEVGNVLWKRHRQGEITAAEAETLLERFLGHPLHLEEAKRLLRAGLRIAIKYKRALYDALFVALVEETRLVGVTADEPLYHAVHADYPSIILLRDWPPTSP